MSSVYVVCWIFLQTFQTYFLHVKEQSALTHTVCNNDFKSNRHKTKQTTIVVTGALRVKCKNNSI